MNVPAPSSGSAPDALFVAFQQVLAGRYSLDHEIGRGGMGIVYLAHEVDLDRPVAIKLLPPEQAERSVLRERFLREARLAARLSHPNIIPIHAVDETGGFVYFVMAYVDGETLAARVRERGPLPTAEAARVLRDTAWALSHAHAQGLVHRDVKPDNIMLEASSGRVLVADFGIASVSSNSTAEGIMGTPEFMSPEQALGAELDGRSDLYSLGATAFYAVTGRLPFEGDSPTQVLAKQITEPAPAVLSMGLPVSRRIATLIDRCLAKNPDDRPASAEALAEQLGVALEQRKELPVAIRVFAKRHARLDGGGTLLALTGAAIAGGTAAFLSQSGIVGLITLGVGLVGMPAAYFVKVARDVMKLGFTHDDVVPALRSEVETGREDRAMEIWQGPTRLERIAATTSIVSAGASGTLTYILSHVPYYYPKFRALYHVGSGGFPYAVWIVLFEIGAAAASIAVLSGFFWLIRVGRRHDLDAEFWDWIWRGRVGKWAFRVAKRLLRGKHVGTVMTHRATELALGMAAENLYESLPRAARAELRELPAVLRRLQGDAQHLREQYNTLNAALAEAPDGGASDAYADVRATRDDTQAKLTDTVTALETIRLNLLRLHAGSATVEGLTTHLNLAADVSDEVERLLAAREEVDQLLPYPRETAATPV